VRTGVVAHDRGDSVALVHAARCAEGRSATRLEHLVLSNANIFLPLSNLTDAQRRILDTASGPQIAAALSAPVLAEAMGATTFTPPRTAGDPEVEALTATFAHGNPGWSADTPRWAPAAGSGRLESARMGGLSIS
jgi:hypothetical protein